MSQAVGSTLDPTEVMRRVARESARVLGADMAGTYLADTSEASLRPIAGYHVPKPLLEWFLSSPIPLDGHAFLLEAWHSQRPVFSSDAARDPRINRETFERFPHRSILFAPMVARGTPIGGLFLVWWTAQRRFTPDELRLVEGISRQSALAIDHTRLFAWRQEEAEISGALLRLAEAVGGARDVDRLLETVTEIAPELLGLTRCGLFLFDLTEGVLVPAKARGLAPELAPAFHALRGAPKIPAVVKAVESLEPVVVAPTALETWIPRTLAGTLGIRSMLIIPLVSGGRLMGTMALDSPGVEHAFTPKQIAIARGIAAHAAVAIDNARLHEETQRALAELRATQEELVRREALRATGEFAAGMAHHVNNLLAVILARTQLVLARVREPEVARALQVIESATYDAADVVRRVLGFGRMTPEREVVPVDLNALAEEVLEMTRSLWQVHAEARGVEIRAVLEAGAIPAVPGNPAALRELLLTLLLNAAEALPRGGRITVRTRASGPCVTLAVSDPGVGMSEEVRRRALDPFFTTKGPKGTGLGLSVAYAIVQRHGGSLAIDSAEGRGTTVTVSLPTEERAGGGAEPRGRRQGGDAAASGPAPDAA
ncbi:MAG: GAF domain-containing protein [Candidatus Rokubacteria bacterium]|nr:GAF domain-containing protein [Candidatus Rokubacteria bacterium]